ncbi:glycine cleavage system protein GcvH [Hyphomonas jannaschiana]|jgi:glycine cleavage system H protein|uniref:Glycine cleavage system H protein n=1 Tax=Hyphomonas jannaschiana VP2 TaxID=1280952 RepID=A0A059FBQ7_9PROT|nr:glycine cleavage system protein GcvH [Hyphomonas jannaschiana]KCZ88040.1 glycine cleavage system H protein [Hyphomonas jannaschiana VP2]
MTRYTQPTTFYTKDHEWVTVHNDLATVGITHYAENALGDIVFVELPEVGAEFAPGDDMAVVESVKAASDVYAPIHGKVVEVNPALGDKPETVNESPTEKGWFCVLEIKDGAEIAGLMDEAAYKAYCETL